MIRSQRVPKPLSRSARAKRRGPGTPGVSDAAKPFTLYLDLALAFTLRPDHCPYAHPRPASYTTLFETPSTTPFPLHSLFRHPVREWVTGGQREGEGTGVEWKKEPKTESGGRERRGS